MARILITWELGAGYGHVTRLLPTAQELQRRGHTVAVALRDVAGTGKLFVDRGIACLPAAFKLGWPKERIRPARTYAHILHNVGFADAEELTALVAAWRNLFDLFSPDAILCEHSPTALLASRGHRARRFAIGDGFCIPPGDPALPGLQPWNPKYTAPKTSDESATLGAANVALARHGLPRIEHLADIYRDINGQLLTTFYELDHFGGRPEGRYFGPCGETLGGGTVSKKPDTASLHAFAYLRPFPGLSTLMRELARRNVYTSVYSPGTMPPAAPRFSRAEYLTSPVDLSTAAEAVDFVILNGTHGTTAATLLAGKPVFQIPMHQEQQIVASRTMRIGAGLAANGAVPANIAKRLGTFLDRRSDFSEAAGNFAAKYRGYCVREAVGRLIDEVTSQLP